MPSLPLKKLGSIGVVADVSPYDLPPNAFSDCNNVVFNEEKIQRAPVFKTLFPTVKSNLTYDAAIGDYNTNTNTYESAEGARVDYTRFLDSYQDASIGEVAIVCDTDGTVRAYPNGIMDDVTPTGTLLSNIEPWSHAQVGGISVLARKGMRPYVRNILSDTDYSLMAGDWGTGDSAAIVRPFLDFFIMLNVTKGATEYPTMVKWCNPVEYGIAVTNIKWDPTNPTYVAGENVLSELKTPIRDGGPLGNNFVIYAQDQVWAMEFTGSSLVFNFRRLFPTGGIINTNCWAEVEGKHFVFGENDIYVHDGNTKKSIADKRVRRKIFSTINRDQIKSFFVLHNSVSNLIYFCYQTPADEANYLNTQYCNKAAVYNYKDDTWSFVDMPNCVGGAEANISLVNGLYVALDNPYELFNTSYVSFEGVTEKLPITLSVTDQANGISESRVFAVDLPTSGILRLPIAKETLKPAFVERIGIDLDEVGSSIRNYKIITAILPQTTFTDSTGAFIWEVGASDTPNGSATWYYNSIFYPDVDYKLDMKVAGRYLAYRITTESPENFFISGFETQIKEISRR